MSSSSRLSGNSFAGLLVAATIAASIGWMGFLVGQDYESAERQTAAEHKYSAEQAVLTPSQTAQADTGNVSKHCDRQQKGYNADLCQQWRMAQAANAQIALLHGQNTLVSRQNLLISIELSFVGLAFLVAIAGAFYAWRSVQTSRLEVRAYVMLQDIDFPFPRAGERPVVTVCLKNFGNTPAVKVRDRGQVGIYPPGQSDLGVESLEWGEVTVIPPGQPIFRNHFLSRERFDNNTPALREQRKNLFVFGEVAYEDIFGNEWYSRYQAQLLVHNDPPGVEMVMTPEGNTAT